MKKTKKIILSLIIIFLLIVALTIFLFLRKSEVNEITIQNSTPTPAEISPTPSLELSSTPNPTPTYARPFRDPMNKEVSLGDPKRKEIALTFDAGASAEWVTQILGILNDKKIHSTFFSTGKWAEQNPDKIRSISQNQNTFGNHTYSHPYLTQISDQTIKDELARTENIIKNITGITTKPYFRAPYGNRNQHVWDVAAAEGYQSIYWTVDALDWQEGATSEQVKERIFSHAQNGAIILMHVGDAITPDVLGEVIDHLESQGYRLVTIDELLR